MDLQNVLEQYKNHPYYGKDFKKLKPIQVQFIVDYMTISLNKDKNEFARDLNRLFIINKVEAGYDYDEVFPLNKNGERKKVSTIQDIMSAMYDAIKG